MNSKGLLAGVALIILIGVAGFLYRSYQEAPQGPVACTTDAKVCPDGTGLGRTGPNCTFPSCPPPNVEIAEAGLAFALPIGFIADENAYGADSALLAAFVKPTAENPDETIIIRRYTLPTEQSVSQFLSENAHLDPSDMPAPPTAFSSVVLGDEAHQHRFSVVQIGRFEGVVSTAYFLVREKEVIRFDAISRNVMNWTDPALDVTKLPANQDLRALLATLQGN